ncbi:hypothetical protein FXQ87_14215 [Salmonella enterica]|nr:hypothetical protein [Salmonella enterica]
MTVPALVFRPGPPDKPDKVLRNNTLENNNTRLFSDHLMSSNLKIWIITERNRSVAAVLLPATQSVSLSDTSSLKPALFSSPSRDSLPVRVWSVPFI